MPAPSRQILRVGTGLPLLAAKTKKSDPRSEVRCPPFGKKNERAVEDDAGPCKKHSALQKRDPTPLGAGSL